MTEQQFKELLKKYENGTATPSEVRDVEAFYNSYVNQALDENLPVMGNTDERKAKILQQVHRKYQVASIPQRKSYTMAWRVAASIAFFLAVGAGIYFWQSGASKDQLAVADLAPGGNKAILQLSDNSTVELDSLHQNAIPKQGSALITNAQGQLAYIQQGESAELIYNKIITPRGGQYQVTLSDGSKVWLNASSSLRYPVAFNDKERTVEVTGEAYFEIAKNEAKPFKVSVNNMEVQVLGTHFNVMAYTEEEAIKTTLIEGSVNITTVASSPAERVGVKLQPGQQAQLSQDGKVQVITNEETVAQAVAWRFGMFRFEDTDMKTIMRQVSRWYDVEVEYDKEIENTRFVGVVSRKANASSVLRIMELTGAIHFEIEPGRIKVKSGRKPEKEN